jgi:hypothetical protein
MRKHIAKIAGILLTTLLCLSQGTVLAEDATFSDAELDQMIAPIALYPDSLLAQILMATTYPADVAEAVEWSKDNPDQQGDAAVTAVQDKPWDPSVMSLTAFPQVLAMMGEQPEWVQNVGDAFLADSDGVMDTVQKLRTKAQEEGNLETTEQQKVIVEQAPSTSETVIIIEPADPQIVYVPTYNPTVVYGTWWWPHYTPWYYYPPGYAFGSAIVRGIGFGIGIGITHALWGDCRWGRGYGSVNINVNKYNNININRNKLDINKKTTNWNHKPENRRGVPYRDEKSRKQFENKRGGADQRKEFRGRDEQREKARATLDKRAVDPSEGRKQLQGAGGEKARDSVSKANRDVAQGKLASRDASRDAARGVTREQARTPAQDRDAGKLRDQSSKKTPSRDNALRGAGNAKSERQSIDRGNSSTRSMNRGGGGGGGGGSRLGGGGGGGLRR